MMIMGDLLILPTEGDFALSLFIDVGRSDRTSPRVNLEG